MDLNVIKEMAMDAVRTFHFDLLSVDHIIPISMGGAVCDIHNMPAAYVSTAMNGRQGTLTEKAELLNSAPYRENEGARTFTKYGVIRHP